MLTRNFGTSSLQVSALGFGAGHIGYDGVTERDALALSDRALDLGINFIDTARGYGLSEERIGRWLPAHRDEVVLSTKVGYGVEGARDWSLRGPLPVTERARWENAFAPHAGVWPGEV